MRFSRHAVFKLYAVPPSLGNTLFHPSSCREEEAVAKVRHYTGHGTPPANSVNRRTSLSTPGTYGRGIRWPWADDDHNPPTNAPPPKRATHQQSSSAGATSQPPPLTEADIPRIVNAVLQGLPSTKDPPATQPDEDEDLEDFNGERVIM